MRERSEDEALERMRELLEVPTQAELEAAVPDLHAAGMWAAVREARPGGRHRRARRRWLVPALAAASVAFAVLSGGLAFERGNILQRQAELEGRLAGQETRLAALETAARGGWSSAIALAGAPDWARELARRETVPLGRIRDLLAAVPRETTLLGPSELQAIATARQGPFPGAAGWPDVASTVDLADGLQAGELLDALASLDLGDGTPIPTARVMEIWHEARRSARS